MCADRLRAPKTEDKERSLLSKVVPRTTQYNTKWAVKLFEKWQRNMKQLAWTDLMWRKWGI